MWNQFNIVATIKNQVFNYSDAQTLKDAFLHHFIHLIGEKHYSEEKYIKHVNGKDKMLNNQAMIYNLHIIPLEKPVEVKLSFDNC